MKLLRTIGTICLCICLNSAKAQDLEKFSQVKIYTEKSKVANLQTIGIDIDHAYYNPEEQSLTTTLSQSEVKMLEKAKVAFTVTVKDVQADFLEKNRPEEFYANDRKRTASNAAGRLMFNTPDRSFASTIVTPAAFSSGSMGGYLTFAEMKAEIDEMVANYPSLVKVQSIGKTHENRDIWAVTISDNVSSTTEKETEVLYTGMHHAREPLAMVNLIFFMQYLLENYSTNTTIKEIVDNRQLVFIPCLNPDGYVYNQSTNPNGGGMWRKNRQPNAGGTLGQDLNRNYGYGFDYNNGGSSDVPSEQNYHGDFAFQAKETQIMRQFFRDHKFHFAINYHSYGGYWIHGNTVPTYTLSSTDSAIIKTTGAMATRNNFYEVGTPYETVGYHGNGTVEDWCMVGDAGIRPPIYSISPEVGLSLGTFWPSASSIIPYCKEVLYGNLQAALFGGAYVEAADKTSLNVASKTGNLEVFVRRVGIVDSSVTVSIIPLKNIVSAGPSVKINSIPTYLGTSTVSFSYTLHPSITVGQQFSYIIQTVTDGITTRDTVVKFFNASKPVDDNMETGTIGGTGSKWSTSTGWAYTNFNAFSGNRSLSHATAGAYTASRTQTVNTIASLNLSGVQAAYLSFWIKYKSEAANDKLQVRVSTDGVNYTALPGLHTVSENKGTLGGAPSFTGYQNHWVREIIDLSPVLNNNNVRLQFYFTSNSSVNGEGFYIDDLEVVTTTTSYVILPIQFVDVKAVRAGKEVSIKWESEIDPAHLYFEVERSADNLNFEGIYKTYAVDRVQFATDHSPVNGTNYYRIKAVSNAGVQYSKVVAVNMKQNASVSIFPNPVAGRLILQVDGITNGHYQVHILNAAGQVVSHRELQFSGQREIPLSLTGLGAGNYQVIIRDNKGELVDVSSFIKL